jgi:hypothetical protein
MFRRGGKAEGGITSGLKRQGYATNEDNLVLQNDQTKVQEVGQNMEQFNKAFPSYNSAGSDFFMNLGSNILSAPGGNPILQTLGTAAKAPLLQMQKTNMANTQGNRELALKFWQSLDDDDKDAMLNRAEQLVEAGRFKTVEEALQVLVPTYRKSANPQEIERLKILSNEEDTADSITEIQKTYTLGKPDAVKLQAFQNDIINDMTASADDKKYKLPYDGDQYFIENDDVTRSSKDERLTFKDIKTMDDYKDGAIYLDLESNTVFVKQGQFFIPYNTYIAEEIPTG